MNKVFLLGEVLEPPTKKEGGPVRVRLETVQRWIDQITGQRQQESERHYVEIWGQPGEAAKNQLGPGDAIFVEGRSTPRHWVDAEGKHHRVVNVRCRRWCHVGQPVVRWT